MNHARLAEADPPAAIPAPPTGLLAGAGTLVGMTALVSSSCCVVPLALAGLGATGAVFSGLLLLAAIRPYLLGVAALTLLAGWWLYFSRQRLAACNSDGKCAAPVTSWRMISFLMLGSTFVGLATIWEPYIEPILLRLVR
ncbi:mercury transporter MerT [Phreatobacter sp. HK31-P]